MISAEGLRQAAVDETGLDDFGDASVHEGLERLTAALRDEAELGDLGRQIIGHRLTRLLVNRLRIEDTYHRHPEIDDERVVAPIFVVGLPRTGTTATSQLLAVDPQIRSLRLWESNEPVPPPEAATQDSDPRIERTRAGLEAMYTMFPEFKSLYFQTATQATECQDLLGMAFRTEHFDGMAHVPGYTDWVLDCDMVPAYRCHRRVLQLLQWRCPPRQWHLKTPVHLLSLDALTTVYPDARFLMTHRDPAAVLGSVCSLIAYTRGMVSDRDDTRELGRQQLAIWREALRRAMAFRDRAGDDRFADVHFGDLDADPVAAIEAAYDRLGLTPDEAGRAAMRSWAGAHPRGAHGAHEYRLEDYGLDAPTVRAAFRDYLDRFEVPVG